MSDPWVVNSQVWLNSQYRDVPGYSEVDVDGQTGWPTMYALTRALQHEIGITALSDNFGAGTSAAFTSKVGSISSSTTNLNLIGILQCAAWCKGYSGDTEFGRWSDTLATSIIVMRNQLGLSATASVDVKFMKSLLTMDAYSKTYGGSDLVRAGQQWLNSKYVARSAFSIIPCDGRYTRDVQRGLLLAIQYEIGMDDATANGYFGTGTQGGIRAQAMISQGSSDIGKSFVSIFQCALAFNGYEIARSGSFSAETSAAALDFQQFMEIAETGTGDYGTWAGLLVSTGDPDRPVGMIDSTTEFTVARAAQMRAEGYYVAGRYLTVNGKSIGRGEIDIMFDAGFSVVPIFQNYNNGPEWFTYDFGYTHGYEAAMRARQLGFQSGVVIFFAVDYDAFSSEIETLLRPYFEGVAEGLKISTSVVYKIGIYSTRNVTARIIEMGLAEAIWVSGMSTGYSGNLGFPMPEGWWYNQIQEIKSTNIDRNAVSVRAQPVTRDQVIKTPEQTDQSRSLHWNVVKQEVLAEAALSHQPLAPNSLASTFLIFYLMRTNYASTAFSTYTPYPESMPGYTVETKNAIALARTEYFEKAGNPADIVGDYDGDLEHLGVTAQGVNYWGAWAGNGAIGIGDLGGWALDLVQLWANYRKFSNGQPIKDFVAINLGGGTDQTSEFQLRDLISDADGWLIGRDVRTGSSFSTSMATWFQQYPSWQARLSIFVRDRFIQSGKSLNESIQQNVESIYVNWPWPQLARDQFAEGQEDPTPTELTLFTAACAETLLIRAGL